MTRGFIVVAYDVCDDRMRQRLHRRLLAVLPRVQKSVFEGPVARQALDEVRRAIREEVDLSADTVRIVHLCVRCRESIELYGTSEVVPVEEEDIVIQ